MAPGTKGFIPVLHAATDSRPDEIDTLLAAEAVASALDGLGYLAYRSISHLDLPVTQAIVMLLSFVYVGLTLAADLVNAWLDPRIRVG